MDLPGYGYANASVEVKAKWGKMIERYLQKSEMLKEVFLLIDIRHKPGANDVQMYDWILHNGFRPIIIATKLDKINRSQVQKQIRLIKETLKVEPGTLGSFLILPKTKQGRDELYDFIDKVVLDKKE